MKVLSAGLLLLGLPAAAWSVSGTVGYGGAALPHDWVVVEPDERPWAGADAFGGGVPHPGPDRRELLSPDGSFRVEGLRPGNYRVSARFQFLSDGWRPTRPLGVRVTVGPGGETTLYDAAGAALPDSALALEVDPGTAAARGPLGAYRGEVRFLGEAPDLAREPLAVVAHSMDHEGAAWLAPVLGPVKDGAAPLELRLPAGSTYILQTQSAAWGCVSAVPQTDLVVVGTAPIPLSLVVARAGAVHGRVLLPDGRPYRPEYACGGPHCPLQRRHDLWIRLTPDAMAFDRRVNPDGTFDIPALPPGRYTAEISARGPEFRWFAASPPPIEVRAGRTTEVELRLRPGAPVDLVAPSGLPAMTEPTWTARHAFGAGRERWIRTLAAGEPLDADTAIRLLDHAFHGSFQFLQSSTGSWGPPLTAPGRSVAPHGRYDVYLVENRYSWDTAPYVVVLGRGPRLTVSGAGPARVDLGGWTAPAGFARLSGRLEGFPTLTDKALADAGGDFWKLLSWFPKVVLRSSSGAAAFVWVRRLSGDPDAAFGAVTTALATGRAGPLRELVERSPRDFEIVSLPAGRYSVEVSAPGCAKTKSAVTLAPGQDATLSLPLDCGRGS